MVLQYDMVQVHLKDNLSYKWFTSKAGCVRGYAYIGKQFLEGETLLAYLSAATVRDSIHIGLAVPLNCINHIGV